MRRLDKRATGRYGIPAFLLMDHAGRAVAQAARSLLRSRRGRVSILTGGGNNGGDGVVAARYLQGWGYSAEVLWLKNPADWKGSLALHYAIAKRMGVRFHSFHRIPGPRRLRALRRADVLIDALLGTGAEGSLRVPIFDAIVTMNATRRPIVSVDLPSGLDADTGLAPDGAVKARVTVTMAAPKVGFRKASARPYLGKLLIADIGLPVDRT